MRTESGLRLHPGRRRVAWLTIVALVASLVTPTVSLAAPAVSGGDTTYSATGRVSAAAVATITTEVTVTPTGAFSGWVNAANVAITLTTTDVAPPTLPTDQQVSYRTYKAGDAPGSMTTGPSPATVTPAVSAEGTTVVEFYSSNTASATQEPTQTRTVRIDRTAPELGTSLGASLNGTATISVSTTDTMSGVASVSYSIDGAAAVTTTTAKPTIILGGAGAHTVGVSAKDAVGNQSSTSTVGPFTITDGVAPTTSISGVPAGWSSTNVTFTLGAVDNPGGTGVASTIYRLNQTGSFVPYTGAVAVSAEGTTVVEFASIDRATPTANQEATKQAIIRIDKGAPTSSISGADIAWRSSNATFTLSATDTPNYSMVAGIRYRLGASALATYTAPVVISAEGTTDIEYFAVDYAGNRETTRSASVRIDRTNPTVSVVASTTYEQSGVVTITGADALSGGVMVYTSLDGGAFAATPGSAQVITTGAGSHTVNYYATDAAGNRTTTALVTFQVTRQTAVQLTSKTSTLRNTTIPARTTVKGKLTDAGAGVAGKRVVLDYSSYSTFVGMRSVAGTTAADGSFSFNVSLSSRTFYRVRFAGDTDYKAASSGTIAYKPKVALSLKVASKAKPLRRFYASGVIKPVHSRGRRVYIEWSTRPGGRRSGYVWATVTPRGSYSSYLAPLTLRKGTWYVRAVAPDDGAHATTATAAKRVIVR